MQQKLTRSDALDEDILSARAKVADFFFLNPLMSETAAGFYCRQTKNWVTTDREALGKKKKGTDLVHLTVGSIANHFHQLENTCRVLRREKVERLKMKGKMKLSEECNRLSCAETRKENAPKNKYVQIFWFGTSEHFFRYTRLTWLFVFTFTP